MSNGETAARGSPKATICSVKCARTWRTPFTTPSGEKASTLKAPAPWETGARKRLTSTSPKHVRDIGGLLKVLRYYGVSGGPTMKTRAKSESAGGGIADPCT